MSPAGPGGTAARVAPCRPSRRYGSSPMVPATSRLGRVHHVGVACRQIEPARQWVRATHDVVADSGIVHDPLQGADLCLLSLRDAPAIELVAGAAVNDLVAKGHSWYHLCHEVDDLQAAVDALCEQGSMIVVPPTPAVLFADRPVSFLLSPLGLVELLEADHASGHQDSSSDREATAARPVDVAPVIA